MRAGAPLRFWREMAVVLAVKFVLLAVLYFAFFARRSPVGDIADHLFATAGIK
jgi:hypothetical protein